MKRKKFKKRWKRFYILFLLVFIPNIVYGTSTLITDLLAGYTMDNADTSGTNLKDVLGSNNATLVNSPTTNQTGKLGQSYLFDGSDDYLRIQNSATINITGNFTVSVWFKNNGTTVSYPTLWSKFNDAWQTGAFSFRHDNTGAAGKLTIHWYDYNTGGTPLIATTNTYPDNQWFLTVLRRENNNFTIFVNGTEFKQSSTDTHSLALSGLGWGIGFDNWDGSNGYFKGWIDDVYVWKRSLTDTEIQELWNNSNGAKYPFGSITPSLYLKTDMINGTINYNENTYQIFYNGTLTDTTTDFYNCSLYDNTTFLNLSVSVDMTKNQNWTINTLGKEHLYLFKINCSNFEASSQTAFYYIKVDSINPDIVSNLVNNTEYMQDETLSMNNTFIDTNLFAYNITIKDVNGNVQKNIFATNISSKSRAENISTYILSDLGNLSVHLQVWDSHTSNYVRPIQWFTLPNKIIVNEKLYFEGDFKFVNNKNQTVTYFYLSPDMDKYKLKLTFNDKKLYQVINISNYDIFYLENSRYKGHFVLLSMGLWIDFESPYIERISVSKLNSDKYSVELKFFETMDEVELESIGDLNYYEEIYYLSVVSADIVYLKQIATNTQNINTNLESIDLDIKMIAIIMLYIFLWIFGLYSFSKNTLLGYGLVLGTIPFDIYFAYLFQEENIVGTGFIGVFFGLVILITIASLLFMKTIKKVV